MITRKWKVNGWNYDGTQHRLRESFYPSHEYDWSEGDDIRRVVVLNSDRTGSNLYSLMVITRNTAEECEDELNGQLSDGIFENDRYGSVEEILEAEK